ncbi:MULTISPECIES: winged helix-turn-helix domain-containing protein [Tenebrionibacter/Tenebrionicola group]|jgi:DNA-binding winged helix-turn-helix (wHTH) protein|uniref:Winged helix-turn-helix domain-containing protein n=2 Tax=Tenebrionibacter/Tenebrionicola group TaxID=2969848 RepID=A0A8K0XW93_9ENTR|nr:MULTISPECIES: helix-turn-helix domain-containing protein [Tenebrionibacter/Tenebrionicola group]MBK4715080.1 winged helix-turn-helix domain-containing protein [Tenebrionibacter intestinalis]MBV5096260.1 winged helix-turn-helix domain-containing protein [Tenebrionicola larvae]
MKFEIEEFIHFDTEDASLVNQKTGDRLELSLTSTRLLAKLLCHRKDVLSRDEIFQSVFDQFGARSSNSNLNQYISILRRNLAELGMVKETITTVPRVGFRISEDVMVKMTDNAKKPVTLPESHKKKTYKYFSLFRIFFPLSIILFISCLFIANSLESKLKSVSLKKTAMDKCTIFSSTSFSTSEIEEALSTNSRHSRKLDCSIPKEIYIERLQMNSTLGTNKHYLFVECLLSSNKCVSYYFREKENA